MNREEAKHQVETTFTQPFNEAVFKTFARNLLKDLDESKAQTFSGAYIKDAFKAHITSYRRLGSYLDPAGETLDVLTVKLSDSKKLDRARTMQRNFIADYLKTRGEKDAAIVAFYNEDCGDWRFSYVHMEYKVEITENGPIKIKEKLTPARRYSFLVGEKEPNHTAKQQISPLLEYNKKLSLSEIEDAFRIESVTKEFFSKYKDLFLKLKDEIDNILERDNEIAGDFEKHEISTANFAKKLMGQIVFLYFVQKKGWLGVSVDNANWGDGDRRFLRILFERCKDEGKNFFNDYLEPLFYDALNNENRGTADSSYHPLFKCRIPFLNGGLFEPMNDYDWENTELRIGNDILAEILDTFDLYNFTVREDEPLEKEVAVDPEMLGKVFENLLEVTDRKSKGAFYTPREIVHYMCQESLINYLDTKLNVAHASRLSNNNDIHNRDGCATLNTIPKADIEEFIRRGDIYIDYALRNEAKRKQGDNVTGIYKQRELPDSIIKNAVDIDALLNDIKICDPAIGSGAFPVGMMNEIVRGRYALSAYGEPDPNRTPYVFKRQCIQDCIYGVDIDPGAIDIAKLRLWLSLIVDEEDFASIQPLPNLDYKIMCGNSLLGVDMDNLFINEALSRIESLKNKYFDETNRDKKQELHKQIDDILFEVTGQKKCFDFKIHFSEVFNENEGFDIVIGNPPYIQIQKFSGQQIQKDLAHANFKTFAKTGDIYSLFYEKGWQILRPNGHVCLITSNKWMRANYGKATRKFFTEKVTLKKLIDFGDAPIFAEATTYTNILIFQKQNFTSEKVSAWDVNSIYKPNLSLLDMVQEDTQGELLHTEDSFIILTSKLALLKRKIEAIGTPLKEWDISIYRGILTGFNEAFIISGEKKDELINKDPNSAEIIKPILRGRDIKKYSANFADLWLIGTFPALNLNIDDYPAIKEYLEQFLPKLKQTGETFIDSKGIKQKTRKKTGNNWFETQDQIAYQDEFEKEKVLWAEIVYDSAFFFDKNAYYPEATAFIMTGKKLKYIIGLLNSKLLTFAFKNFYAGGDLRGNTFRYKKIFFEKIPLLKNPDRETELIFTFLVDIITFLKTIEDNLVEVSFFEQIIDALVFELYFPDELHENGFYMFDNLTSYTFPAISSLSDNKKLNIIHDLFNEFYDKNHPVRKNLFFFDTIDLVRQIMENE